MHPFIMIHDFMPTFVEEYSKLHTNYERNFCRYLLNLAISDSQESDKDKVNQNAKSCNMEQYLINAIRKRQTDDKHETKLLITVDELVPYFLEECAQNFLQINPCFANYYLHLLIRDAHDGLQINVPSNSLSICKIENFLKRALSKFRNSIDPTLCHLKMSYYLKQSHAINLYFVKEKYEMGYNEKLKELINSILQYPETSTDKQLEDMFIKMQIFILTNYYIGCPSNNVLLKQCRQSLNSILGKGDLQKYVLRKKYHRLEYLQKLGATAAGILIFNNQSKHCNKEYVRDIFADLKMAQLNTKDSLEESINRTVYLTKLGFTAMQKLIKFNIKEKNVYCLQPIIRLREMNKFVTLFEGYRYNLLQLREVFEKTQYLIEISQKKFNCVVEKINNILKYRSAIESKLIFPHFVYLSEVWTSLLLYLNHLVELNKIKDYIDDIINEKIENKFNQLLEELTTADNYLKLPIVYTFHELMSLTSIQESQLNLLKVKPFIKDYCALTMALTNGFLVPSNLEKKLCENSELRFGFANIEYAKYAERYFVDFTRVFRNAIVTSNDLLLLFQLDEEVMELDFNLIHEAKSKTNTLETQTEMVVTNDLLPRNHTNTTWNVWDFHRECIKLANIRKKQTHSAQTKLSYGLRNAQNQAHSKIKCNKETQK